MLQDGDRKVIFKGSIRECLCKLAALTDAPRPTNSIGVGYSDDDHWSETFQVVQDYFNEGTFKQFVIMPHERPDGT